jgi:putative membrane protein
MLTKLEEDRITAAVAKAEEATTGEIFVILANEVSRYREVPLAWAAAVALALPPIVLALTLAPLTDLTGELWLVGQMGRANWAWPSASTPPSRSSSFWRCWRLCTFPASAGA